MADFGFVGPSYEAPSIYQDGQECINFRPEIDPLKGEGQRGVVALYPTPGLTASIVFQNKQKLKLNERNIIPNDTKLFAQADCEKSVEFYLSSDTESLKIYNLLKQSINPKFQFIDLNTPYNEIFGVLDFG
jgi:hypothetical protein